MEATKKNNEYKSPLLTPRTILLAALAVFAFLQSIYPLIDFDTWWHLKTGQYIWQTKSIPFNDIFSYTIYGKPWVAFEWLAQAVFYGIYSAGGIAGLILFKALIAVLILLAMIQAARKSSPIVIWLLFAPVLLVMRDALRERPQLFTYIFSAVFLAVLRNKRKSGLYLLPVIQIFWANLHGVAGVIGLCMVIVYALFDNELTVAMRAWLVLGCCAASFFSPNTWRVYGYLYNFFSQGFRHFSMEYQPPGFIKWFIPFYALAVLISVSFVLPGKRKFADILIVFGTLSASLAANRNIPVFLLLSSPVAAERYSSFLAPAGAALSARLFLLTARKTVAAALAAALLFAIFWHVRTPLDFRRLFPFDLGFRNPCMYAAEFIAYCDEHGLRGNLFNDYDFGGYLIWRLWPGRRVFVDGRLVEFGEPFVRAAQNYNDPKIWDRLESDYHFTAAVVSSYNGYKSSYLDSRRDWFLVYWDDNALVYLKNAPGNNDLIRRFGYTIVRPGSPGYGYLLQYPRERVLSELNRALTLAPHCVKAQRMKEFLLSTRA